MTWQNYAQRQKQWHKNITLQQHAQKQKCKVRVQLSTVHLWSQGEISPFLQVPTSNFQLPSIMAQTQVLKQTSLLFSWFPYGPYSSLVPLEVEHLVTCGRLEVVSVDELASTTCHHTMAKARNGQIQRSQEGQCGRANLQSLAGCQGQNLSTQTQTCKHHIIIIITSKSHHIHHPSSNCITSTSKQKHITKHTRTTSGSCHGLQPSWHNYGNIQNP